MLRTVYTTVAGAPFNPPASPPACALPEPRLSRQGGRRTRARR